MSDGRLNNRVAAIEKTVAELKKSLEQLKATSQLRGSDQAKTSEIPDSSREHHDAPRKSPITTPAQPGLKKPKQAGKDPMAWWKRAAKTIRSFNWKRSLEITGIVAGIGYAGVTYLQWRDLRHNFEVDERALLKITPSFPETITENMKIEMIPVNVLNLGKSVGLQVAVQGLSEVLENDRAPGLLVDRRHTLVLISLLYPDDPDRLQIGFGGAGQPIALTQTDIENLLANRSYIAVHGQAQYRDQFGLHWIRYCAWKSYGREFVNQNTESCLAFNTMGDGKPPDR